MGGWRYVILWGSIFKHVTDLTDPTKVFFFRTRTILLPRHLLDFLSSLLNMCITSQPEEKIMLHAERARVLISHWIKIVV